MKIILGADAVRYPLTGIGRYTFELARHLQDQPGVESIRYLVRNRVLDAFPPLEAPHGGGERQASLRVAVLRNRAAVAVYRLMGAWSSYRALRTCKDAIFHGPNYYVPPHPGPSVSTFHDLSIYRYPQHHPEERTRYMYKELALSLKRVSMLICDSEYVRQELMQEFAWPAERVAAIPLACSEVYRPRAEDEARALLARFALQYKRFTLYVGTIEPRKNLALLLDAYERLPIRVRQAFPLVLAGYKGWGASGLHARFRLAEQAGWLRYLGYVSDDDLPMLYASARVFAYPSLYEGFGLPVLEAMASGTPVVCSNASSLPEVVGVDAAMHEPADMNHLAALLGQALDDDAWCLAQAERGLARAAGFSWERTAQETLSVYKRLI